MALNIKEFFAKARQSAEYWAELATLDFTAGVERRMEELKLSRAELANRIGTSPAYITKVLNGTTNFTIKSMATLAHALDQELVISLSDKDAVEPFISVSATFASPATTKDFGRLIVVGTGNRMEFDATNEDNFRLIA